MVMGIRVGTLVSSIRLFSTCKVNFTKIPSTLPSKGLISLKNNSNFLKISGKDASIFINGLTTIKLLPQHLKKNQTTISNADINNENIVNSIQLSNDLINNSNWGILHENEEFDPTNEDELPMRLGIRRDGRYSNILRANGRIFSDVFIYPTPFLGNNDEFPSYLIEILNKSQFKPLLMMLKLHKLRANVEISEINNIDSWFYYDDSSEGNEIYDSLLDQYFANANSKDIGSSKTLSELFIKNKVLFDFDIDPNSILGLAIDQRNDYFGIRILMNEGNVPPIHNISEKDILPYENYTNRRIKYGIVETIDFANASILPFECNLDWMHGINYDKGCYIGQELTIRTWTGNGATRRVLPIIFNEEIKGLNDSYEKLELKAIVGNEDPEEKTKEEETPVYNPFGKPSSSSSSSRPRRDVSKVGEVLINNGKEGLAKVEKRYFDWDNEESKQVNVVHDGKLYNATINTNVWN